MAMLKFFAFLPLLCVGVTGQDFAMTETLLNARRGMQGAADMNKIIYKKEHEAAAAAWGSACKEEKPSDSKVANFDAAFFYLDPTALIDIAQALNDILNLAYVTSKASYTLSTNKCQAGKEADCRLYKTMSYGGYKTYGCALLTTCSIGGMTKLDTTVVRGKYPLLCVLEPKMTSASMAPFTAGPPCSKCTPGYAKCEGGTICALGDPATTAPAGNTEASGSWPGHQPHPDLRSRSGSGTDGLLQPAAIGGSSATTAPAENTEAPGSSVAETNKPPTGGDKNAAPTVRLSALLLLPMAALQLCVLQRG